MWNMFSRVTRSKIQEEDIRENHKTALVLSGGGARAAYQVGALKALLPELEAIDYGPNIIIGSSIGAINGLVIGACLKEGLPTATSELETIWTQRRFRNTFAGHPSKAFIKAVSMAISQWVKPGPKSTSKALFDPTPLRLAIDETILKHGGLDPESRAPVLDAIGVMTTVEDNTRRPLLLVSTKEALPRSFYQGATFEYSHIRTLSASHGLASAALPAVLPPVELETHQEDVKISLIDGGISQNVPVDPAVRLGGDTVVVIDISGRDWWHDQAEEEHDTKPFWEVPSKPESFCHMPLRSLILRCQKPLGPILEDAVGSSTKKFMRAVGPVWPLFKILHSKLGKEVAYEFLSYVALDEDYLTGIMERGFNETTELMNTRKKLFHSYTEEVKELNTP